jgi:hypothetical protein
MPFAGYKDFAACVAANKDKGNPDAYCGAIKHKVEKEMLDEIKKLEEKLGDNPIQENPVTPQQLHSKPDEKNVPEDQKPDKSDIGKDIDAIEKYLKGNFFGREAAENPIQANPGKPQQSTPAALDLPTKDQKPEDIDIQKELAMVEDLVMMNDVDDISGTALAKDIKPAAEPAGLDIESEIIDFLRANPNPEDSKVHAWAEEKGIEPDKLEAAIYAFATKLATLKQSAMPDEDFDAEQLKKGTEVETEHVDDPAIAKGIAKAHLKEDPEYYTKLAKMEGQAEKKEFAEYLGGKKEFTHYSESRIYIKSPAEAPKGANVQRGKHGGFYYDASGAPKGAAPAQKPKFDTGHKVDIFAPDPKTGKPLQAGSGVITKVGPVNRDGQTHFVKFTDENGDQQHMTVPEDGLQHTNPASPKGGSRQEDPSYYWDKQDSAKQTVPNK